MCGAHGSRRSHTRSEIVSSELNAMVMPRALLCLALVPFSVHASEATLEDHDEEFWFTLYLSVGLFAAAVVLLARAPLCFGLCGCVRLCRRRLGRRRPQPASPRAGPQTPYQKSERRLRVAAHSSQRRRPGFSLSPAQSPALNPTEPVHEASGAKARRATEDSLAQRWQLAKVRLESAEGQRNFGDQLGYRKELEAVRAFRRSTQYSVFIGHVRSKANFIRESGDPALRLPPAYTAERAVVAHTAGVLYYVLLSSGKMQSVLCTAVGLALLSTALAPWASFASAHPDDVPDAVHLLFALARSQVGSLIASYSFFPLFLLLGLLSYVTARWRDWLVNSHTVQAALHDIGLGVGSCLVNPDAEAKAAVYDLYRYLNAIHALLYQSVVPHLPQKPSEMIQLGLLTKGEAEILGQAANKQRDLLLTWAGQRVEALRQSGHIDGGVLALSFSLLKLRAMCARHHDLFLRHMPNIWFAASRLLVDLLIALLLIQLPLNAVESHVLDAEGHAVDSHLQSIHCAITAVGAFFVAFAFGAAWSVVELLSNPFAAEIDTYNVDPLLASSERCLFVQLRSAIIGRELLSRAARESPVASAGADDLAEGSATCVRCVGSRRRSSAVSRLTETIGAAVARGASTAEFSRDRGGTVLLSKPNGIGTASKGLAATAPAGSSEVVNVILE